MLKYMLDTDIIIYTIKNNPTKVREAFDLHNGQMCISSVTLGELIYGAERSSQIEHNLSVIDGLVARLEVLSFDENAAAHFGNITARLADEGELIRSYDLMIAGHARSMGLILVSNNLKEFKCVQGLQFENWV